MKKEMIENEQIYSIMLRYSFSFLNRKDQPIEKYLKDLFDGYVQALDELSKEYNLFLEEIATGTIQKIREKIPFIKKECDSIVDILTLYTDGHQYESYGEAKELFDSVEEYFLPSFAANIYHPYYYRIRSNYKVDKSLSQKEQKAKIFHIKKTHREKIGAYRYSVPGYPCLYLAEDLDLAWIECGLPKTFSYVGLRLKIPENSDAEDRDSYLRLVDLGERPIAFGKNIEAWLRNAKSQKEKSKVVDYLIRYIVTYPLVASCSLRVIDRSVKFVEEYIIPQFLMQWILDTGKWDGVSYASCRNSTFVDYFCDRNIAIPIRTFRGDGLGKEVTEKFEVSDVKYLDTQKYFKDKYKDDVDRLDELSEKWLIHIQNGLISNDLSFHMYELGKHIVNQYRALMNGDYSNAELVFEYLNTTFHYALSLKKQLNDFSKDQLKSYEVNFDWNVYHKDVKEFEDLVSVGKLLQRDPFLITEDKVDNFELI